LILGIDNTFFGGLSFQNHQAPFKGFSAMEQPVNANITSGYLNALFCGLLAALVGLKPGISQTY
jgi:hypothetical protein